jgi:hypothetical protein
MIGLQPYPFDHEPYSKTPKTIAFKAAAESEPILRSPSLNAWASRVLSNMEGLLP